MFDEFKNGYEYADFQIESENMTANNLRDAIAKAWEDGRMTGIKQAM